MLALSQHYQHDALVLGAWGVFCNTRQSYDKAPGKNVKEENFSIRASGT